MVFLHLGFRRKVSWVPGALFYLEYSLIILNSKLHLPGHSLKGSSLGGTPGLEEGCRGGREVNVACFPNQSSHHTHILILKNLICYTKLGSNSVVCVANRGESAFCKYVFALPVYFRTS